MRDTRAAINEASTTLETEEVKERAKLREKLLQKSLLLDTASWLVLCDLHAPLLSPDFTVGWSEDARRGRRVDREDVLELDAAIDEFVEGATIGETSFVQDFESRDGVKRHAS